MAKEKAHKVTRKIVDSKEAKNYKAEELVDTFKGKVVVFDPERSEVVNQLRKEGPSRKLLHLIQINLF